MGDGWAWNVGELEGVMEWELVVCEGPIIQSKDLVISTAQSVGCTESLRQAKGKEIARFERDYIQGLLSACKGNITKAAQVATKNRRAFCQLIQKYKIDVSHFKSTAP